MAWPLGAKHGFALLSRDGFALVPFGQWTRMLLRIILSSKKQN